MSDKPSTIAEYVQNLPEERVEAIEKLRAVILANLPEGFIETLNYGMIGYVVPHTIYPNGYHCDTKLPLPFMNIASQKNFVALCHMGMYANPDLLNWFTTEYGKRVTSKLDMGKSCVRFKKMDQIPYELVGELVAKMTVKDWIDAYESNLRSTSKK